MNANGYSWAIGILRFFNLAYAWDPVTQCLIELRDLNNQYLRQFISKHLMRLSASSSFPTGHLHIPRTNNSHLQYSHHTKDGREEEEGGGIVNQIHRWWSLKGVFTIWTFKSWSKFHYPVMKRRLLRMRWTHPWRLLMADKGFVGHWLALNVQDSHDYNNCGTGGGHARTVKIKI